MKELFTAISSLWDKIQQFSAVIWDKIVDAWTNMQLLSTLLPPALVGVFVTAIILIIVLRIINR